MSTTLFWPLVLCLFGALIVQGVSLRVIHQRRLKALRSEHRQVLTGMHGEFEQLTLQLRQLQREQEAAATATLRIDPAASTAEVPAMSAREALERELDAESDARYASSGDGFADTQILAHEGKSSGLLLQ